MKPTLQVQDVAKSFPAQRWPFLKRHPVLQGISFSIAPGQLVGLVGENGSGKSTLLKIIVGVLAADAGSIRVRGPVGYCPQDPILFDKLTVAETFQLFGRAYGLPSSNVSQRAAELLDQLQFERYKDMRVEHLSGGTRQKLNLCISLLHAPSLLLLDEPYAGFDYETYLRFWDLAMEIVQNGQSLLIVSHFINERDKFDEIYTLREGKCVLL